MFKIDLHVHTLFGGDSVLDPETLVARSRQVGLDALCVTEHHSYFLSDPYKKISQATRFPIFQGLEYRAMEGHLLIYGLHIDAEDLPPRLPMQWTIDWVQSQGGIAVPAHPFQRWSVNGFPGRKLWEMKNLIAVETLNGSLNDEENRQAAETAERMGIRGIGGSDAHGPAVLGRAYTVFPEPIRTEEELVAALRQGRYLPVWNHRYYGCPSRSGSRVPCAEVLADRKNLSPQTPLRKTEESP